MRIQAKMRCMENAGDAYGHNVRLECVYDEDPSHPNFEWSQATPSGECRLHISNPGAFEAFVVGMDYLVSFEETPELQPA